MASKQNRSQEFKRAIDMGRVDLASPTDLVKIWRIATGDEKAITLEGFVATVDRDILDLPGGNVADLEDRVTDIENGEGIGIGITLNNKVIGGVKNLIELTDVLDIPSHWEYNVFKLDVDGLINIELDGAINMLPVNILAEIGTPVLQGFTTVSADYTLLVTDRNISVTASGVTITLPTAQVSNAGYEYKIDNASIGNIFVVGEGAELIQGESTQTIFPDSCMNIFTNGTGWRIS